MNNNELGIYNGTTLVFTDDNKINLTDMWRAGDGKYTQRPSIWLGQEGTKRFLESLGEKLNVTQNDILNSSRGVGGGTWGHYQVALAYAKYLSPEFHIWCNEVVKERIETEGVPETTFEIPKTFAEALMLAGKQAEQMALDAPKIEIYDTIMSDDGLVSR